MNLFTALGVLFIALKLLGYITWSWWIVLAPLYGPLAFTLIVFVLFAILSALAS